VSAFKTSHFAHMGATDIILSAESGPDYREVEYLTREAFWNLYAPGCAAHYLLHLLRSCSDYIPELGFNIAAEAAAVFDNTFPLKEKIITDTQLKH